MDLWCHVRFKLAIGGEACLTDGVSLLTISVFNQECTCILLREPYIGRQLRGYERAQVCLGLMCTGAWGPSAPRRTLIASLASIAFLPKYILFLTNRHQRGKAIQKLIA